MYQGNSIVDYLKSVGQPSDFASRATLAASKGISGYVGSAEQNTQLLNMLRGGGGQSQSAPAGQPSPQQQSQQTAQSQVQQQQASGGPQSAQDLINMGFTGYAGWGNAEAVADYKATGGQGKGGSTQGGGGGIDTSFLNQPTINLPELYEGLFASSGIKDIENELSTKSRQYAEQVAKIKDNPYLSEATMTGRLSKLQDKFNADTANIRNDIAMRKADIETQLNLQTKQFDIQSQQATQALNQFNSLLSSGALDSASGEDIANITRATGISSSMIQSAINARKKTEVDSQLITSTADSGEVTATLINTQTGEIIKQTSLGNIGNQQTSGGGGTVSERKESDYQQNRQNLIGDIQRGAILSAVVGHYSGVLEVEEIYRLYNTYSPYGQAEEDIEDVKQGRFNA